MRKIAVVLAVALALGSTASLTAPLPEGLKVVRVDARSHRLFVAPASDFVVSSASAGKYLEGLAGEVSKTFPDWGTRWSVSFFSDPAMATYKDDPSVSHALVSGAWVKAYLAEYEHASHKLVWSPAQPERVRRVILPGPR